MFNKIAAIYKREFKSYFDSPVAYVFLTAFLALVGFLTFSVGFFYERRQADLTPFFFWHPWVYLLLVPAATMGTWADERRNGTVEQLLTLPVTVGEVLVGKFLAAWSFIAIAIALTLPVPLTAGYLGTPDWGVVLCGYIGSLLMAGAATAIGVFGSVMSRSSVVGFIVSLASIFALLMIGFDPVIGAIASWGIPMAIVDGIADCSLLTHFEALRRGVVDLADIAYYAGMMVFFLLAAKTVTDGRRGASKGVAGLTIAAVAIIAVNAIIGNLPLRADFTEQKIYTLSEGSKKVLAQLDGEITLKYYVSSSSRQMPMNLKTYATQVGDLLKEYVRFSKGNVVLEQYDPKPDSDAEEWAQRYGIEPQTVSPLAAPIYFGVAATCGDREEAMGAISPSMAATLEYNLTRLITRVRWPERPVVGVMSSIADILGGEYNPMMMQMGQQPPKGWTVFAELGKDYDVRTIATDVEEIPADVKTLIVVHAKALSDKTLFAIDQFVLKGGKLIACVDPMSVKDLMASRNNQMGMMNMPNASSTLGKLFTNWGITFAEDKIASDLAASTKLSDGRGGYEDNPAFLSLGEKNVDSKDAVVAGLTQIMFPFAGSFEYAGTNKNIRFEPVIFTSNDMSAAIPAMNAQFGMSSIRRDTNPDGKSHVIAARLSGDFTTAYPKGPDGTNDTAKVVMNGKGAIMLFADSDFIADDFCVRVLRTPFGSIPQPLNDNIALFSNIIEQFAGREELIGIRTRGNDNRPFTVVDDLEAQAMAKWREKEEDLTAALQEARQRLSELRKANKAGGDRQLISREQQEELQKFMKKQAEVSRELKNVRKELTSGIDALGSFLKWLNILLMPLVAIAFGIIRGISRKRG